jgi:hypothetical protein
VRRAATLVEVSVAALLACLVAGMISGLFASAQGSSHRSVESSDAVRSALIAMESIRSDVGRLTLESAGRDIAVLDGGRGLSLHVARPLGDDLWRVDTDAVTYRLDAVDASRRAHRLVRQDSTGRWPLAACLLGDMLVTMVSAGPGTGAAPEAPPRPPGASGSWLEVSLIGVASRDGGATHVESAWLPLAPIAEPLPYVVLEGPR